MKALSTSPSEVSMLAKVSKMLCLSSAVEKSGGSIRAQVFPWTGMKGSSPSVLDVRQTPGIKDAE